MVVGTNESGRRFIETEPIGKTGEHSEQKVWDAVKKAFSGRNCIGYWSYPIFSRTGETRKEPDILIVDRELGILIVEVKGITIDQITSIQGHLWKFQNFYCTSGSPYKQAENQLYSLLAYCDREEVIRQKVHSRVMVALPLITEKEWQDKGFDRSLNCPPILFKDQLGTAMLSKVQQTVPIRAGKDLDDQQWETLLAVIGGTPVLRKPIIEVPTIASTRKSRSSVINDLCQRLYELDLQQTHIGMEIPPGPQRIRGIAGSGKTVLLCQKAAHMHLKHPDWDIALVFFTRSLYDQIENLVDKWVRHFSSGDITYKDNPTAQRKLRVLHAWGARDRAGFYRTICESNLTSPLGARDTDYGQPNEGLADISRRLLEGRNLQPIFDAVLIDEGQDLVVDNPRLLHEEKQAIYWMAYQSLKPVSNDDLIQKRLIWAYDEAQSLSSSAIPSARGLFGDNPAFTRFVTGTYKGGIKKSEIMHRCYRTPAPILTAAHAIGMGFLRPEGMLTGITQAEQWRAIGYEVQGDFRVTNGTIKLHRPAINSPNPVPDLWDEPVLQLNLYGSRHEELTILASNIKYNLGKDRLTPSRQILVIVLGDNFTAGGLEREVANFLINQGIDIFIPTAKSLNTINPQFPNTNPDKFWHEGGVTISRIARAKGNEAEMVYVVGLDHIANKPDDIGMRNQLFVAMTRSRGWLTVSGTGNTNGSFYQEFFRVIQSGSTFEFINNPSRQSQRDITEPEIDFETTIDVEVVQTNLLISNNQSASKISPELLKSIRCGNKAHHPYKNRLKDAAALGGWDQEAEDILYAIAMRGTNPAYTIKNHENFLASITKIHE
ncbi:MAG: DNA/RNA helicase [Oscillatoriales cyanobacterium CG2_30_44_21]|nr:MAG: DNA/RNA helicase [Oscillatoriales cyanobacterium CG2_30_44_21]